MTRPKYCRKIESEPAARCFRPVGINTLQADEIIITLDEFEALRLADFEGLYQENCAARMNISRQTFGRIIDSARKKTARALIDGMALRIEGGVVSLEENGEMKCSSCIHPLNCCENREGIHQCPRCRNTIKK